MSAFGDTADITLTDQCPLITQTPKLVQPALEVEQDVHLLTVKFFEREELGEVKLSILKEGNDNVCLECRDGHAHYTTPE